MDAALKAVTQEFGAPTILVNNAGITRDNLLLRMKEDEVDECSRHRPDFSLRLSKAVLRG